jgi:hypothetical protein
MADPSSPLSRRDLLKAATVAGAGITLTRAGLAGAQAGPDAGAVNQGGSVDPTPPLAASMIGVPFEKRNVVRFGIVGTGLRGKSTITELLGVENVRITALCDVVPEKVEAARQLMKKAGHDYEPAVYTAGEHDFESLCRRDDIDFVYTATPWQWHVPVVLAAMENGKHAGTEVPAAYTLDDCWKLVDTSERTRRHCLLMENCCYGYNELLVLGMVRAGLLGDIIAGGAAYNHDLREILFENRDEGLWRRAHHTQRNSNLYPTHGLGPVAMYMDVNRGDRFDYMVSMSTGEFGLTQWRAQHEPKDSLKWGEKYVCGDLNRSLIRTAQGRVILLEHDVSSPRPYSRINSVQGTKGIFEDYPARIYIEKPNVSEAWRDVTEYKATYEHPFWRAQGERARSGGHGGMDYIQAWRLVQCMRLGIAPDMDVYDAATWSAPGPLSEQSVSRRGQPVAFPDFTRGGWKSARLTMQA